MAKAIFNFTRRHPKGVLIPLAIFIALVAIGAATEEPEAAAAAAPTVTTTTEATTTTAVPATSTTSQQATSTTPSTVSTVSDDEPSLAFQLAAVDTGDSSPNEGTVAAYQTALDAVEGSCRADPNTTHADYALKSKELAAGDGVSVDALEVLQGMAIALDGQEELGIDCAGAYAVFLVLLTDDS